MRNFIVGLGLFLGTLAQATDHQPLTFRELGQRHVDAVWKGLDSCGLVVLNPRDPRLPLQQVPASLAIANKRFQLLAYYYEQIGFGLNWEFKNPNGGLSHSVTATNESIHFTTPYAGNVAHANRFMTPSGPGYNFYCRSMPIATFQQFQNCIAYEWSGLIVRQLCRFPLN